MVQFPDTIKTRKAKVAYWAFNHWYYFNTGKGSVIGRFSSVFTEVSVFFIFLKYFGFYDPGKIGIVLIITASLIICYVSGRLYSYWALDRIESLVLMKYDQYRKDMHKLMVKDKGEIL